MEAKKYGLDVLARVCAGDTGVKSPDGWAEAIDKALAKRYELGADGQLWLIASAAVCSPRQERDAMAWQPIPNDTKPALPIPFTAAEFAAFTLAGMGVFVVEPFESMDDEDMLDEDALADLGRNGAQARELLRESLRLRLEARRRFGQPLVDDGTQVSDTPLYLVTDEQLGRAAEWLLGHPGAEGASLSAPVPTPATAAEPAIVRRKRLLELYDAEVSAGRARGALARITAIEKQTRPTADRANLGRDIRRARAEREEERRGGALPRLPE